MANFPPRFELSSLDGTNGFRIEGIHDGESSGWSVSAAGDVNGDGVDDLLIGTPGAAPGGRLGAGESYVIFGTAAGFTPVLVLSSLDGSNGFGIKGIHAYHSSGYSVSNAGDVNGDGVDDLLIGAPGASPGGRGHAGESYVVFGTSAGFAPVLQVSSLDGHNGFRVEGLVGGVFDQYSGTFIGGDHSGSSVSNAGDVNGDGVGDLLIGAYEADPGGRTFAGESYVVFGTAAGFAPVLELSSLDGSNGFRIEGIHAGDTSGRAVSAAGDVNGDGVDDLLIGANYAAGGNGAGESHVVFGTAAGFAPVLELSSLDGSNGFRIEGIQALDSSGSSVSNAGDVNGDGVDDLIIGAPFAAPDGRTFAGESYVVFGTGAGFAPVLELSSLDGSNGFRIEGIQAGDASGLSVSNAGDVNGDGVADLLIGAHDAAPGGRLNAGESYVVFGTAGGFVPVLELSSLDGSNGFRIEGIQVFDFSGRVSAAGDVNGDGVDDLLIGAPFADPGGRLAAGESYVLFGRSSAVIDGTAGGDHLRGDVAANRIEGMGGDDRLEGAGNTDTLHGGAGLDQLFGGDGKDVLDGGAGRDIVFGGHGADVFVLGNTDSFDLIRDFSIAEDDKVRVIIPEVINASGEVDGRLVHGVDGNGSMLIQVDQDFDASNGFQAVTIASIAGAGSLALGEVLENGLF